jgi:hypothetical protein
VPLDDATTNGVRPLIPCRVKLAIGDEVPIKNMPVRVVVAKVEVPVTDNFVVVALVANKLVMFAAVIVEDEIVVVARVDVPVTVRLVKKPDTALKIDAKRFVVVALVVEEFVANRFVEVEFVVTSLVTLSVDIFAVTILAVVMVEEEIVVVAKVEVPVAENEVRKVPPETVRAEVDAAPRAV